MNVACRPSLHSHPVPPKVPPPGWTIPEGWTYSGMGHCRSCGSTVAWCVTRTGKHAPVNADATSHFSDCPQADAWRRRP